MVNYKIITCENFLHGDYSSNVLYVNYKLNVAICKQK